MSEAWARCGKVAAPLFIALAVAACSGAGGGDAGGGGSATSIEGRLSVRIPPGALAAPTAITIQPITDTAPVSDPLASNDRLQPEGMTFAVPVTLTFHLGDDEVDELNHMSAAPPASIAPCSISPLSTNTMSPGDGSLEIDYTASHANSKVTTTGGKTFWPVTVRCEGMSYPAALGRARLAPDQTFASDGNVTFTIGVGSLTGTATLYRNY